MTFLKHLMVVPAAAVLAAAPATPAPPANNGGGNQLVITKSGSYVLKKDLLGTPSEPAVLIQADNVTLDLDGHSLMGPGNKLGMGIAIFGKNIRVTNGSLKNFGIGVKVEDSNNVSVEKLQISGEDLGGAPPDIEIGVLLINSRGAKVADNIISNTFLGIFVRGEGSGANTVKVNTLAGGNHGQLGICYNPAPGADGAVDGPEGDLVSNNHISRFRLGIQTSPASAKNIFSDNYISYFDQDVQEMTPGSNVFVDNVSTQLSPLP